MHNCPNCGAPITGPKCEYCGTVFWDRRKELIENTVTLQMQIANTNCLQKCIEAAIMTPNQARRMMGLDPI